MRHDRRRPPVSSVAVKRAQFGRFRLPPGAWTTTAAAYAAHGLIASGLISSAGTDLLKPRECVRCRAAHISDALATP
jgi:hypothetical protein